MKDAENPERKEGVFPVFHCAQEIPCNPCTDVCPRHSIKIDQDSLMGLPRFEGTCTGCTRCVSICPGLAVTLVDYRKAPEGHAIVTVPLELLPDRFSPGSMVPALDRDGKTLGDVKIHRVLKPKFSDRTLQPAAGCPRGYRL